MKDAGGNRWPKALMERGLMGHLNGIVDILGIRIEGGSV